MKSPEFQSQDNMNRKQLKWEKPLNRKNAIKEFMEEMRRPKPFSQEKVKEMSKPWMKRKTPLRSISNRRLKETYEYARKRKQFLDSHNLCQVWLWHDGWSDNGDGTYTDIETVSAGTYSANELIEVFGAHQSTEVHHKCCGKNRKATYLREDTWMAVSAWGHDFIHKNPKLAYERGWLLKTIPEEPTNAL